MSPLQEATAIGFEKADEMGFWEESKKEMKGKMDRFNQIWDELGLPVSITLIPCHTRQSFENTILIKSNSIRILKEAISSW